MWSEDLSFDPKQLGGGMGSFKKEVSLLPGKSMGQELFPSLQNVPRDQWECKDASSN